MAQFQLGGRDVVVVEVEVRHEEALEVALRLYAVAYRRHLGVGIGHEAEPFLPYTVVGHVVVVVGEPVGVYV